MICLEKARLIWPELLEFGLKELRLMARNGLLIEY